MKPCSTEARRNIHIKGMLIYIQPQIGLDTTIKRCEPIKLKQEREKNFEEKIKAVPMVPKNSATCVLST
jgi:hypothetical protein